MEITTGYGNTAPFRRLVNLSARPRGCPPVSADISGLEPATTYHYRLIGRNSEEMTIGSDETLTTNPPIKDLVTTAATEIGPASAVLNGTVDPDGIDTTYYFEWGPDTSYGHTTAVTDAGSTAGNALISAAISGLEDYAVYHYRLVAKNSFGTTVGEDVSFLSAPPLPPSIPASGVTSVTSHSATLAAEIVPGFGPTYFRFQFGTDTAYGSRTPLSEPIGSDDSPQSQRNYRTPSAGTPTTSARSKSTSSPPPWVPTEPLLPPTFLVSTRHLDDLISQTTAVLTAQINPSGAATTYRFDYGPTAAYGEHTPAGGRIDADTADHTVTPLPLA